MENDVGNSQGVGPFDFDHQAVDRLFPELVVGAGEIQEIRGVADRVGDAMLVERVAEEADIFLGDFLSTPLVVVLGEQLHAVTARLLCRIDRLVITAGHRHVGA
jgi:hypothetical protein